MAVAHITWNSPTTISGDRDVSTSGTLVAAYNIGGPLVASTALAENLAFSVFALKSPKAKQRVLE
jgi:hypothetical protein